MLSRSLLAAGIVGGLLAAAHPAAAQWPNQFGTYQNSPQVYAPSGTYLGNLLKRENWRSRHEHDHESQ